MIVSCPCGRQVDVPNRMPVVCECGTRYYMEIDQPVKKVNPALPVMWWGLKALVVICLILWVWSYFK